MKRLTSFTATLGLVVSGTTAAAEPADPRLREVVYDPRAVVTVPVKRGVVTLVVLDADVCRLDRSLDRRLCCWCLALHTLSFLESANPQASACPFSGAASAG